MSSPPPGYRPPRFPSLNVKTLADRTPEREHTLYYISDVVRFTILWTLIIYGVFHLGAVFVAMTVHSWTKSSWRLLWVVPIVYLLTAGLEGVFAGSLVGVVLGGVYKLGSYEMSTWIPCVWGAISVLVLIISSFSIQGGL
jgi:hypothetical protein